jgi:hypothetical protein
MCCAFTTLVLLGPRAGILLWYLVQPMRWQATFSTWIWPLLGAIFVPWLTLMYVIVSPAGITGFDWLWLGLALVADIASYGGGAYGNRNKIPGYSGQ